MPAIFTAAGLNSATIHDVLPCVSDESRRTPWLAGRLQTELARVEEQIDHLTTTRSILAELVSVRTSLVPPPRPALAVIASATTTAIDPVCHMTVAAVPASLHLEWNGATWYFCGPGCKQAFADDPARYPDPSRSDSPDPAA